MPDDLAKAIVSAFDAAVAMMQPGDYTKVSAEIIWLEKELDRIQHEAWMKAKAWPPPTAPHA